jgi:hypothetical protein
MDLVPVERYASSLQIRYRGDTPIFIYQSEEYGVMIAPYNVSDPVHPYNKNQFKGMSNEKTTVQIPRWVLETCRAFLKKKEEMCSVIDAYFPSNEK